MVQSSLLLQGSWTMIDPYGRDALTVKSIYLNAVF